MLSFHFAFAVSWRAEVCPLHGSVHHVCVEAEPGETPTLEVLAAHVKARLAAYKAPRNVVVVSTIGRAPNGKVDYKRLKQHAIDTLGAK